MSCDDYCNNNGCNAAPGCLAGAARVTRIKASHAPAAPAGQDEARDTHDASAEGVLWVALSLCLVFLAVGAAALVAALVMSF